jgi:Na+-transporting NADH:ubiquinone oxidoreductase subunit E
MSLLRIAFEAAFVENLALTFFLGMCTFLAVSRRVDTALGLGAAVIVAQTITVPVNALIRNHLLRPGALAWAGLPDVDVSYLSLMLYIGVIAAMIQILEMFLERHAPRLHGTLGIFLPLLTVNCAILGGTLFSAERQHGVLEAAAYGLGSGVGWALAIAVLAGIRERLRYADPPAALRGLGLTFLVVGIMALAFLGLAGIRAG